MTAVLEFGLAFVVVIILGVGAYFSGAEGLLVAFAAIGGIATCLIFAAIVVRMVMVVVDAIWPIRQGGNHRG